MKKNSSNDTTPSLSAFRSLRSYRWNPARRLQTLSVPPLGTPRLSPLVLVLVVVSLSCWLWVCVLLAWPRCAPSPAPRLQSRTPTTHMELVRISTAGGALIFEFPA